jgi:hypothetical protein
LLACGSGWGQRYALLEVCMHSRQPAVSQVR